MGYPAPDPRQQDEQHLKLLAIFHCVLAAFAGLTGLFPIVHVVIGLMMIFSPSSFASGGPPPPAFMGVMFAGMGAAIMVYSLTLAGIILAGGIFLQRRRRRTFCFVAAGAACLFMPVGTILGVFSIIVLARPSVAMLFDEREAELAAERMTFAESP